MKSLWVLVGGNGVGKSTFYHQALKPLGLPFINADMVAAELWPDSAEEQSYKAAQIAETMRQEHLTAGTSFCFETVFSHPSKIDFLAQAKAHGYYINLVVIHLESAQLNQARISQRVAEGGHSVPSDKVIALIPRTMANVANAIPLCDEVFLLDNSNATNPFVRVLTIQAGVTTMHVLQEPIWVSQYLTSEA